MFPEVHETPLQFIVVTLYQVNVILTICGYWLLQNLEESKKINKFNRLQAELFSLPNLSHRPRIQACQICSLSVYTPSFHLERFYH